MKERTKKLKLQLSRREKAYRDEVTDVIVFISQSRTRQKKGREPCVREIESTKKEGVSIIRMLRSRIGVNRQSKSFIIKLTHRGITDHGIKPDG